MTSKDSSIVSTPRLAPDGRACEYVQEEYLSADDLAAVHLHVLDCGLFGNSCNNSFPHMNGGSYYDSG